MLFTISDILRNAVQQAILGPCLGSVGELMDAGKPRRVACWMIAQVALATVLVVAPPAINAPKPAPFRVEEN